MLQREEERKGSASVLQPPLSPRWQAPVADEHSASSPARALHRMRGGTPDQRGTEHAPAVPPRPRTNLCAAVPGHASSRARTTCAGSPHAWRRPCAGGDPVNLKGPLHAAGRCASKIAAAMTETGGRRITPVTEYTPSSPEPHLFVAQTGCAQCSSTTTAAYRSASGARATAGRAR